MNLERAQKLALETDYAVEAVGEEINTADAAAFFLEGYEYAIKSDCIHPFDCVISAGNKHNCTKCGQNI